MKLKIKSLLAILLVVNTLVFTTKVYAIEKPTYVDWIRDLYEYSDEVTDEEIIKEKGFEDEAGRVFFKNPNSMTYEHYTGTKELIASIMGFRVGNHIEYVKIDLSKLKYEANVTGIVSYLQTDFPDIPYSSGTVANSGCGATSLAMVYDSLTNANMGVRGMVAYIKQHGNLYENPTQGTNHALFTKGARDLGLTVKEVSKSDLQGIVSELSKGHPIIVGGKDDNGSLFTSAGHLLVLTGINEDGTITINDPNFKNSHKTTTTLEYLAMYGRHYWSFSTPAMEK